MKTWILIMAVAGVFVAAVLFTESKWEGDVTEGAAAPLAEKAGVEESEVLPWKVDGDLLLFFFLSGGAAAGFAAGYYWRTLFSGGDGKEMAHGGKEHLAGGKEQLAGGKKHPAGGREIFSE